MSTASPESIVITGMGLILPCGDGVENARQSWLSGVPCFSDLPPNLGESRGGACSDFNPVGVIPPMQLRRLDRTSRFAWAAAHQAFQDANMDPKSVGDRVAIAVGTLTGGSESSEMFMRPYFKKGPEGASPMVFPNCVANAAAGHVALAFGIKGPSTTQLERENGTFAALSQASRWLRRGVVDAVLVIGTDGLFPLQIELLRRTGRLTRHGDPKAGLGTGYLPGEGAQAFLLETRSHAESRGVRIRAELLALASASPLINSMEARAEALTTAVEIVTRERAPSAWIGGSSGLSRLDVLETHLRNQHPAWPEPRFPKLIWGEFCGVGGPLLAAALLEKGGPTLLTGPASLGCQYAAMLETVNDR